MVRGSGKTLYRLGLGQVARRGNRKGRRLQRQNGKGKKAREGDTRQVLHQEDPASRDPVVKRPLK